MKTKDTLPSILPFPVPRSLRHSPYPSLSRRMPVSTFVVGDVHGRGKQLSHLLSMLPREAGRDSLVLLGDLIDRGEDIVGTVADVLELQQSEPAGSVVTLRGNHEQMLL